MGVPTLAEGYLPWPGTDRGVPILAGGYPKVGTPLGQGTYPPWPGQDGGVPQGR